MAVLFHDIGKIGVDEAILRKPGRLTEEEFNEMKKHPEIGANILKPVKQFNHIIPGILIIRNVMMEKGIRVELKAKKYLLMVG